MYLHARTRLLFSSRYLFCEKLSTFSSLSDHSGAGFNNLLSTGFTSCLLVFTRGGLARHEHEDSVLKIERNFYLSANNSIL